MAGRGKRRQARSTFYVGSDVGWADIHAIGMDVRDNEGRAGRSRGKTGEA
jgi:hypothetical protein